MNYTKKVNSVQDAIELFLKEKSKRSENSQRSAQVALNAYLSYSRIDTRISVGYFDSVDLEHLVSYQDSLLEQGLSNNTVSNYMAHIKTFLRFLRGYNYIYSDLSYLSIITELPSDTNHVEHMSDAVIQEFMQEIAKERSYPELKLTLVRLAIDTGLRMETLLSLKEKNFTVDGNEVIIRGWQKGNKEYIRKIDIQLYKDINAISDSYFSKLKANTLVKMMKRIRIRLGYEDRNYSFHSFRKVALTDNYLQNKDIVATQRYANHSSASTTETYIAHLSNDNKGRYSRSESLKEVLEQLGQCSKEELLDGIQKLDDDTIKSLLSIIKN